jgi:Family of unknown function (DUF5681)
MPDLDQIKQGEQEPRDRGGRFAKGRSGNPAGRPRGCREAAVALAAFSDTPELQHADGDSPAAGEGRDRARGDAFKAKILYGENLGAGARLYRRAATGLRQSLLR